MELLRSWEYLAEIASLSLFAQGFPWDLGVKLIDEAHLYGRAYQDVKDNYIPG